MTVAPLRAVSFALPVRPGQIMTLVEARRRRRRFLVLRVTFAALLLGGALATDTEPEGPAVVATK